MSADRHVIDWMSEAEADAMRRALEGLQGVPWAQPLLRRVGESESDVRSRKDAYFEARVAFAIHQHEGHAEYEHPAGVGGSTIDFRVPGTPNWLIETVRLGASEALLDATRQSGMRHATTLTTGAEDPRQSEEGERIKAQERIAEKVFQGGKPVKFPPLSECADLRMILVDTRLIIGGDDDDWNEIAYGAIAVPEPHRHFWGGEPLKGLFEEGNPIQGAALVRERIHFLGFVHERDRTESTLVEGAGVRTPAPSMGIRPETSLFAWNPGLFAGFEEARAALDRCPLGPGLRLANFRRGAA